MLVYPAIVVQQATYHLVVAGKQNTGQKFSLVWFYYLAICNLQIAKVKKWNGITRNISWNNTKSCRNNYITQNRADFVMAGGGATLFRSNPRSSRQMKYLATYSDWIVPWLKAFAINSYGQWQIDATGIASPRFPLLNCGCEYSIISVLAIFD